MHELCTALTAQGNNPGAVARRVAASFASLDPERQGRLATTDFVRAMSRVGLELNGSQIDSLQSALGRADVSHRNSQHTLDYESFISALDMQLHSAQFTTASNGAAVEAAARMYAVAREEAAVAARRRTRQGSVSAHRGRRTYGDYTPDSQLQLGMPPRTRPSISEHAAYSSSAGLQQDIITRHLPAYQQSIRSPGSKTSRRVYRDGLSPPQAATSRGAPGISLSAGCSTSMAGVGVSARSASRTDVRLHHSISDPAQLAPTSDPIAPDTTSEQREWRAHAGSALRSLESSTYLSNGVGDALTHPTAGIADAEAQGKNGDGSKAAGMRFSNGATAQTAQTAQAPRRHTIPSRHGLSYPTPSRRMPSHRARLALAHPFLSSPVPSTSTYLIPTHPIQSCVILPHPFQSCPILSYPTPFYPSPIHLVPPYPRRIHPVLSRPFPSRPGSPHLLYPIQSHPTPSHLIQAHPSSTGPSHSP